MKKINILTIGLLSAFVVMNDAAAYVKSYCTYTPSNSKSYIAGRALFVQVETFDDEYDETVNFKNGYGIGFALGAKFDNFRIEGEMKYMGDTTYETTDFYDVGYTILTEKTKWSNSRYNVMFNGYYDFDVSRNFGVYAGGGLGFGINTLTADVSYSDYSRYSESFKDTLFVYQLGFGVSYFVNNKTTLDLGYKYGGTSETKERLTIYNHEMMFGIRYNF